MSDTKSVSRRSSIYFPEKMDSKEVEVIKNELECTVCYDVSTSPIYSCKNGHILCGFCFESVKKCGLCRGNLSPCDLAERLVKKHDIKSECKNLEYGCRQLIRLDLLRDHLKICEYRLIKCFEGKNSPCDEKLYSLTEFSQHLITHHKIKIINRSAQDSGIFKFKYSMSADRLKNIETTTFKYGVQLFHYNDEKFLFHAEFKNGLLIWWVTVLGGQKKANEFGYQTSFVLRIKKYGSEMDYDLLCTRRLPVLPIHGHSIVNELLESGDFANIHLRAFKKYLVVKETSKYGQTCSFRMDVKMTHLPTLTA